MSDATLEVTVSRSALTPSTRIEQIPAKQAALDAFIAWATKVRQWPLVEEAIALKVEEQVKFVQWWDETVSPRGRPEKNSVLNSFSLAEAEDRTGIKQPQVSRWRKHKVDPQKSIDQQILAAYRKAGLAPGENHRAECSGEFEWYTPARYLDLARNVMGAIDLDPATSVFAQQTVRAERYFTADQDGLAQSWHGRVWLNPPYSQPAIMHFIEKLVAEYAAGRVSQAILLTHNYTDTAWFHLAESAASLLCFTKGRISFVNVDGDSSQPTSGQAFFYFGTDGEVFREIFRPVGFIR